MVGRAVTKDEFLKRIGELNVWRTGGQRAPHKPLLLLLALGDASRGRPRQSTFAEIEPRLRQLLVRFGPPRKAHHPEFPFIRLGNDGVWDVTRFEDLPRNRSGDVSRKYLVDQRIAAGFPNALFTALAANPGLIADATQLLLDGHFPASLHEDIRNAVGLTTHEVRDAPRRARDPKFRHDVLRAYERHCAVCGFDIRLVDDLLGLEAAHIKWHAAGGPDKVCNGLALCGLHHKALDRGAIGIEPDGSRFRVLISAEVNGHSQAIRWLLDYAGQTLRQPIDSDWAPHPAFVDWHRNEVFRGPARPTPHA